MIGLEVNPTTGQPVFRNGVWTQLEGTIGALGVSVVIDTLLLTEFDSLNYVMNFKGATQDDVRAVNMDVLLKAGSLVETVSGKRGPLKIGLDTNINGSSFELLATNPENFAVDYCLTVLTI
jgi:hypothetical protein